MPELFRIHELVLENLEYSGFEVVPLTYEEKHFEYKNIFDWLKKIWFRDILQQKHYKRLTAFRPDGERFDKMLQNMGGKADFCFMIWLGSYPPEFIAKLRGYADTMVYYNWEALDFLEENFDRIEFFDKFYFFDPFDKGRRPEHADKLYPITSFYFDCFTPSETASDKILFIGSYAVERNSDIRTFCETARAIGLPVDFRLASRDIAAHQAELGVPEVKFFPFEQSLSYRENLEEATAASVLVDFLNRKHYGLSLRIFESVGLDKKLITTNPTVVHYDFYHPDNMFYWDGSNVDALKDFLTRPYAPLAPEIKRKYSFSNWINCAFGLEPHIPITLPDISRSILDK